MPPRPLCRPVRLLGPTGDRSPLNWFGGKSKLAAQIVRLLPPHDIYVEPFCGGMAVLYCKPPVRVEIVNDIHADVVNFFRVLREQSKELQRRLKLTPYARDEHAYCKANPDHPDPVERARRFFVRTRQSFAAAEDDSWGRSISSRNRAGDFAALADRLHLAAERLRKVQIENRDGLKLLSECDREGLTAYIDPNYLPSTRSRIGSGYRHAMTEDDHARLLESLLRLRKARAVLSGYRSPLYDRALKRWTRYEFTRKMNASRGESKPIRTEVVWVSP